MWAYHVLNDLREGSGHRLLNGQTDFLEHRFVWLRQDLCWRHTSLTAKSPALGSQNPGPCRSYGAPLVRSCGLKSAFLDPQTLICAGNEEGNSPHSVSLNFSTQKFEVREVREGLTFVKASTHFRGNNHESQQGNLKGQQQSHSSLQRSSLKHQGGNIGDCIKDVHI